jgi:hypothetical protein
MTQRISIIIFVSILFLFISATALVAQNGVIKGKVFNSKNNEPLPFTNIIIQGKPTLGASSDINGNYTISNVEPGYVNLVASAVGFNQFVSESFLVTRSHPVFIDIPMDELVTTLSAVTIRPSAIVRKEESPVSMQTLSIQEIEKSPGSNRDISRVI